MTDPTREQAFDPKIEVRRQRVFLVLSGLFLGTLAMLNILGISYFIDIGKALTGESISVLGVTLMVAVGVLPYPLTFLCTDLISEFYGRRRANELVWMGVVLNLWIVFIFWLGSTLPPGPTLDAEGQLDPAAYGYPFFAIKDLVYGAVAASMIAFAAAQFCDVYLYHFWKRLTRGRMLWLRNNGSTLVSQLVDTVAVILITHYYAGALPLKEGSPVGQQLFAFILAGYLFKLVVALLDTIPIYLAVNFLKGYLQIDPLDGYRSALDRAQEEP